MRLSILKRTHSKVIYYAVWIPWATTVLGGSLQGVLCWDQMCLSVCDPVGRLSSREHPGRELCVKEDICVWSAAWAWGEGCPPSL